MSNSTQEAKHNKKHKSKRDSKAKHSNKTLKKSKSTKQKHHDSENQIEPLNLHLANNPYGGNSPNGKHILYGENNPTGPIDINASVQNNPNGRCIINDSYGPNGQIDANGPQNPNGRCIINDSCGPNGQINANVPSNPNGRCIINDSYGPNGQINANYPSNPNGRCIINDSYGPNGQIDVNVPRNPNGRYGFYNSDWFHKPHKPHKIDLYDTIGQTNNNENIISDCNNVEDINANETTNDVETATEITNDVETVTETTNDVETVTETVNDNENVINVETVADAIDVVIAIDFGTTNDEINQIEEFDSTGTETSEITHINRNYKPTAGALISTSQNGDATISHYYNDINNGEIIVNDDPSIKTYYEITIPGTNNATDIYTVTIANNTINDGATGSGGGSSNLLFAMPSIAHGTNSDQIRVRLYKVNFRPSYGNFYIHVTKCN